MGTGFFSYGGVVLGRLFFQEGFFTRGPISRGPCFREGLFYGRAFCRECFLSGGPIFERACLFLGINLITTRARGHIKPCFYLQLSKHEHTILFTSPWKWPWRSHKHKHKDQNSFLCVLAFSLQQVKLKYHSGITQIQGYLPHMVLFGQWKHWVQITSRLNSLEVACACSLLRRGLFVLLWP